MQPAVGIAAADEGRHFLFCGAIRAQDAEAICLLTQHIQDKARIDAMQTAAARVDADLNRRYRQQGQEAPSVRGRLLLGIDGDAQAERLVRRMQFLDKLAVEVRELEERLDD